LFIGDRGSVIVIVRIIYLLIVNDVLIVIIGVDHNVVVNHNVAIVMHIVVVVVIFLLVAFYLMLCYVIFSLFI
jgi:hypothetical protein